MKLIYMQSTIDFIASKHSHRIPEIELIGTPTLKDIEGIKYFLFNI